MNNFVPDYHELESTQPPISIWRESLAFFAAHSTSVVKVLLPPTFIAYVAALVFQHQIGIVRAATNVNSVSVLMSHGLWAYERIWMPMQALIILRQWFTWVCYSFALIGICSLVIDVAEGTQQFGASVFFAIRERPLRFLGSTTLFFGVLIMAYFAMTFLMTFLMFGIDAVQRAGHIELPMPWETWIVVFVAIALVSAVIVRWAFAVPLSVLHGIPFGTAMKASDRLTDYRMLALWRLVMESEIMGYLALVVPSYLLFYMHVQRTPFTYYVGEAAAIFFSAITQAPLMVGIGLVLAKKEREPKQPWSELVAKA
jgi:hypothetical protein